MNEEIRELIRNYPNIDLSQISEENMHYMVSQYLATKARFAARSTARDVERVTQARPDIVSAALTNVMNTAARDEATRLREAWSESLLSQGFTLPSGELVLWADATVEQHRTRAHALETHAASEVQTAAIHRRAEADIISAGATTLRGVVEASA